MAETPLNEKAIEKRMMTFNNTQESVQGLSLWIMHNRSAHQKIVDTWMKVLRKSETKHKLTLFYLCNDVVQHAKKKKALYYLENFKDNLREAVHIVRELDTIKPNISRIFKIWEERRIYDVKFITELRKILESGSDVSGNSSANATPTTAVTPPSSYKPSRKHESKVHSSKEAKKAKEETKRKEEKKEEKEKKAEKEVKSSSDLPGEFKTTKFIEEMTNLKQMDSDANLKAKQLAAMRIDATNMDAVKQLKDRSHGAEFCKQFEESCLKIEDYVALLEKEIAQRKQVLAMCADAELFYDEQYSEAKIVATAYKNFGARVTNMKKRVDDMKKIIPATPSPVPSPSADAPSPGNTPPLQEMDDNDTVDMEIEEDSGPAVKIQEPGPAVQTGGAYTAMVKSIPQPISSVTNITMREEDDEQDSEPKPDSPVRSSAKDSFQGSNILESRIASMLPSLAKGTSSIGPKPPVIGFTDAPDIRKSIPDFTPPKPAPPVIDDDPSSSTPVLDEPEEEEEEKPPSPVKTPPISKPPTTKVKPNPIDFLSSLLTKTSNSSSSSNFLQSLSLLTNTVKSQFKKKEEDGESQSRSESITPPVISAVEPVASFAAVPPPESMKQTSSWGSWKTIISPPQPPLPQNEPPSPPVLPVKSPEILNQPQMPARPPLPPDPFPVQPPSAQTFPIPPPASQSFLTPSSIAQPYGPPRPNLQPFSPNATSPPAFQLNPVISQAFSNPSSVSSASPVSVLPPGLGSGFNPRFPFSTPPPREPPVQGRPPPPQIVPVSQPPPMFMQDTRNSWERSDMVDRVPPISQSHVPNEFAPPPPDASLPPMPTQRSSSGYGNVIHTLSSSRSSNWNARPDTSFGQGGEAGENSSWDQEAESEGRAERGYAHPWDQPQNYNDDDEEEYEIVETRPAKPLPPAPKSILRNRSSSLKEVMLVDDSDSSNSTGNNSAPPLSEKRSHGILKKPPVNTKAQSSDYPSDVQSEFIAKLKQKSSSSSNMPFHPPSSRTLTSVSIDRVESGDSQNSGGQPISTIGVINSNGRTASVKSDDMDLDSDDQEPIIEGNIESWDTTEEQTWQEERQGYVSRDYDNNRQHPEHFNRPPPPAATQFDSYPQHRFEPHEPRFHEQFRGPPPPPQHIGPPPHVRGATPPKRPFFQQSPRMPYYRY